MLETEALCFKVSKPTYDQSLKLWLKVRLVNKRYFCVTSRPALYLEVAEKIYLIHQTFRHSFKVCILFWGKNQINLKLYTFFQEHMAYAKQKYSMEGGKNRNRTFQEQFACEQGTISIGTA